MKRALAMLALLLPLAANADPVLISGSLPILTAGFEHRSFTGGDFDRDGRPDFLIVHPARFIAVHLGRGDGTFAPPVHTPFEYAGDNVAAGDYTGDGIPDLATGGHRRHDAVLFIGRGDGTFVYDTSVFAQYQSGPLGFGDFTGDGHLDLVSHGVGFGVLHVWEGRGDGSFRAAVLTFLQEQLWGSGTIESADFDRDGKLDAVVRGERVTIIARGNGDGTFGNAVPIRGSRFVAIADFDSDGRPDLATTEELSIRHTFNVAMSRPDGTFPWQAVPAGHPPRAIAAADMSGDGVPDIVTSSDYSGEISVAVSRNDGTFAPPRTFLATTSLGLAVADYDGDGANDVLTGPGEFSERAWLVPGRGDGTLRAPRSYPTRLRDGMSDWTPDRFGVRLADVTGDGILDAVTLAEPPPAANKLELAVLPGLGGGRFGPPVHTLTEVVVNVDVEWVAEDFDGDGRTDVVLSDLYRNTFSFFSARNDGTFRLPVQFPRPDHGKLLAADFTGDGRPDVAVSSPVSTLIFPSDGAGGFGAGQRYPRHGRQAFAADLDGDGTSDIAFTPPGSSAFTRTLGVADVDGDGHPDLVEHLATRDLRVHPGLGDGTFGQPYDIDFDGPPFHQEMLVADVDRDGRDDMLIVPYLLLGNGDVHALRFGAPFGKDAADLDGNGTLDFALETISGTIGIVLTNLEEGLDIPTSVTIVPSHRSPRYGEEVTYRVRVSADSPYAMGGIVRLDDNGRTIGYGSVGANGLAEIQAAFEGGAHSITATFSRSDLFAASTTPALHHEVAKGEVLLRVSGSRNPAPLQEPLFIDVSVAVEGSSVLAQPSGTLQVFVDGALVHTGQVDSTLRLEQSMPVGRHVVTARYSGDANYAPATATYVQDVRPLAATVSLFVTPGEQLTLVARVEPAAATGTVTFFDGDLALLTVALHEGVAVLAVPYLDNGPHVLTARYSGDDTYTPAVSQPIPIEHFTGIPPRPRRRSVR